MNYFIPNDKSLDSITIPIGMVINPSEDLIGITFNKKAAKKTLHQWLKAEHLKDDNHE